MNSMDIHYGDKNKMFYVNFLLSAVVMTILTIVIKL